MNRSPTGRRFGVYCSLVLFPSLAGCNAFSDSNDGTNNTTEPHSGTSNSSDGRIPIYAVNHTDEKRDLSITISGGEEVVSKRFILETGEHKRISSVSSSNQPITAETRSGLKNSKPAKPGALSVTIHIRADSIDIRSKTFSNKN